MLNKVILIGRITSDIELRKTNSDSVYTYFTIAVNRARGVEQKTDFISCVSWRKTAELMAQYLRKGSLIAVEGRLEVFRLDKEGSYETRTNVNVLGVQFLESKEASKRRMDNIDSNMSSVDINFDSQTSFSNEKKSNKTKEIDFPNLQFSSESNIDVSKKGEEDKRKEDILEELDL